MSARTGARRCGATRARVRGYGRVGKVDVRVGHGDAKVGMWAGARAGVRVRGRECGREGREDGSEGREDGSEGGGGVVRPR